MFAIPPSVELQNILIFLVFCLGLWFYFMTRLPANFPPGPRPLPIIGNLATFAKDINRAPQNLAELSRQYGNVIGIKLGSYNAVILNGSDAIKEAFIKNADSFSGRPKFMMLLNKLSKNRGVLFTHGPLWKASRRFALSNLRDFGMGKRSIEAKIQEEAFEICKEFENSSGKPFNVKTLVQEGVSNIICSICFGERFEYQDKIFAQLMGLIEALGTSRAFWSPANFIPVLGFLTKFGYGNSEGLVKALSDIESWITERVKEHRTSFDSENIRDFIDVYLKEEQSGIKSNLEVTNIVYIIRDLFIAGTETTNTSIRWLLLIMLYFPEVQRKCQEELDANIGEKTPELADREKLPYIEAVIHESLRFRTVAPMGALHVTEKNTTLYNYTIPKDTVIISNLYTCHTDPNLWESPQEFRPERWIRDGRFQQNKHFISFSTGPRVCLGETLARSELFLFLTVWLQRLSFYFADKNHQKTIPEANVGMTSYPPEFEMIAEVRIK